VPPSSNGNKDVPRAVFVVLAVLLAGAGALVHVQSALYGKFVYDDAKCVVENPVVTSATLDWTRLVNSDFWGTPLASLEVGRSQYACAREDCAFF
jgi:hypothetical protein